MYLDELVEFCLSLPDVEETQPFGPEHVVYKTKGKMFLLVGLEDSPIRFNVKCDPTRAIQLREDFPDAVLPGYHMNKKHWNTIVVGPELSRQQLEDFILHSYTLVHR
jgi:predicted DNA-binding protein (MmcQ/YjbR family)